MVQGRPKVKNVRGSKNGFMYLDLQNLRGPHVDFVLVLEIIRGSTDPLDPPDQAPLKWVNEMQYHVITVTRSATLRPLWESFCCFCAPISSNICKIRPKKLGLIKNLSKEKGLEPKYMLFMNASYKNMNSV